MKSRIVEIFVAAVGGTVAGALVTNFFTPETSVQIPVPQISVTVDDQKERLPFFIQEAYTGFAYQREKFFSWLPFGDDRKIVGIRIIVRNETDKRNECKLHYEKTFTTDDGFEGEGGGLLTSQEIWSSDPSTEQNEKNIIKEFNFENLTTTIHVRYFYDGNQNIQSMKIKFMCAQDQTRYAYIQGFPLQD